MKPAVTIYLGTFLWPAWGILLSLVLRSVIRMPDMELYFFGREHYYQSESLSPISYLFLLGFFGLAAWLVFTLPVYDLLKRTPKFKEPHSLRTVLGGASVLLLANFIAMFTLSFSFLGLSAIPFLVLIIALGFAAYFLLYRA